MKTGASLHTLLYLMMVVPTYVNRLELYAAIKCLYNIISFRYCISYTKKKIIFIFTSDDFPLLWKFKLKKKHKELTNERYMRNNKKKSRLKCASLERNIWCNFTSTISLRPFKMPLHSCFFENLLINKTKITSIKSMQSFDD